MAQNRSENLKKAKKDNKIPTNNEPTPDKNEEKAVSLALKMLEKEHELEKNPLVVHELIAIYSEAIEYYSQINDLKYIDLKTRMQKILMRPDILQSIQAESKPVRPAQTPSEKKPEKQLSEEETETKPNHRVSKSFAKGIDAENIEEIFKEQPEVVKPAEPRRHNSSLITPDLLNSRMTTSFSNPSLGNKKNLTIILDRHTKTTKNTLSKAASDFKSQDNSLERRLATRNKVRLGQSVSFASSNSIENSGIYTNDEEEGESNKTKCFIVEEIDETDKYEKMLEEILETNYSQRAAKIAEIKVKYETQISEMAGMGEFMKAVVDQMRTNMQDEINSAVLEFDNRKKQQIDALKNDL